MGCIHSEHLVAQSQGTDKFRQGRHFFALAVFKGPHTVLNIALVTKGADNLIEILKLRIAAMYRGQEAKVVVQTDYFLEPISPARRGILTGPDFEVVGALVEESRTLPPRSPNFALLEKKINNMNNAQTPDKSDQAGPETFDRLQKEMIPYLKVMKKAADVITAQDVSSFPIFVVHQHTVDIGINIVDRHSVRGGWSIHASTLEEFVTKQILSLEKVEDFKLVYNNHQGELCLFFLSELGANFVFMPSQLP